MKNNFQSVIKLQKIVALGAFALLAGGTVSTAFSQTDRTTNHFSELAATTKHETFVKGLFQLDDFKMAILECRDWFPNGNHYITGRFFIEEGQSFEDKAIKGAHVKIEIIRIHSTSGVIEAREDGKDTVYRYPTNAETNGGLVRASLRLNDSSFKTVFDLYSVFSKRTLLIHPLAHRQIPTKLTANPRNKAEAVQSLENALREKGFAVIPDGSKFAIIVPNELVKNVNPHSADLPVSKSDETISSGTINFENVQFEVVRGIYANLIGRDIRQEVVMPGITLSLDTRNPLTKAELVYALDVLLDWQGFKIVIVNDKTAKVVWTNPQK